MSDVKPVDHLEFFQSELQPRLTEIRDLCKTVGYPFVFVGTSAVQLEPGGSYSTTRCLLHGGITGPEHAELAVCLIAANANGELEMGYNLTETLRQYPNALEGMLHSLAKAGIIDSPKGNPSSRLH